MTSKLDLRPRCKSEIHSWVGKHPNRHCMWCPAVLEGHALSAKQREAEKKAARTLKGGADDTPYDHERLALVELAQSVARDEAHWSVVDVADRAENASGLADAVLKFFGIEYDECPKNCKDCEDHNENTDNESEDDDES